MNRRIIVTVLSALCFFASVSIMLYPVISNYVNQKYRSEIQTAYVAQLERTDDSVLQRIREAAEAYNETITPGTAEANSYSKAALIAASEDYNAQLNPTGDGTMGYLEIPKIHVNLPIFHGTDSGTLERGIGHLLGSSLPVGGESTHAILSGHSGMASQKMFTDLSLLDCGDVFYLHVLNETLAYQVDDIHVVLPHDTAHLQIAQGQDYCTLVTCTPIGINTHRLLVRGHRISYKEALTVQKEIERVAVDTSSDWEAQYFGGLMLGCGVVLVATLIFTARVILMQHAAGTLYSKGGRYLCRKK